MTPRDPQGLPKEKIKLRAASSGKQFSLPGVGAPTSDWSIPTAKHHIERIVGQYLVPLTRCCCGEHLVPEYHCTHCKGRPVLQSTVCTCHRSPWAVHKPDCPSCKQQGRITISEAPVNAVIDSQNRVRTYGTLLDASLADSEAMVNVTFGTTRCHEDIESRDRRTSRSRSPHLTDIATPSTPSPCVSPG